MKYELIKIIGKIISFKALSLFGNLSDIIHFQKIDSYYSKEFAN